jgi:hypothetical protein
MYDAGNVIQIHHHFCTASNYSVTTGFYLIKFLKCAVSEDLNQARQKLSRTHHADAVVVFVNIVFKYQLVSMLHI